MKKPRARKRKSVKASPRRLTLEVAPTGKDLTLEFMPGKSVSVEHLARGVSLERDKAGMVLRLRLSRLDEPWVTNGFLTPSIACTLEGCAPIVERDGTRHYDLGIGAPEAERPFYFGREPVRKPSRGRHKPRNPFSEAVKRSEERIDDLLAFVLESFDRTPDLRQKYPDLYRGFRDVAARREKRAVHQAPSSSAAIRPAERVPRGYNDASIPDG